MTSGDIQIMDAKETIFFGHDADRTAPVDHGDDCES